MTTLRLAVFGVTGRMGQSIVSAIAAAGSPHVLSGALASSASARLGADAALHGAPCGVAITADPVRALQGAQVALDFSAAGALPGHAEACATAGVPLLVGVTGFDAAARAALEKAAARIAVMVAPNTSFGVGVLAKLVAMAARTLGESYEVEISDAHHRHKRDAPSGTALALGATVAAARGVDLEQVAVFDRHTQHGARRAGSIGFSAVRAGDIVGEHTVIFATDGERLELTHRATDRVSFARGALRAAAWLAGRDAGLYGMQDMLGL